MTKPNLPAKSTSKGIQKAHTRIVPTSRGYKPVVVNPNVRKPMMVPASRQMPTITKAPANASAAQVERADLEAKVSRPSFAPKLRWEEVLKPDTGKSVGPVLEGEDKIITGIPMLTQDENGDDVMWTIDVKFDTNWWESKKGEGRKYILYTIHEWNDDHGEPQNGTIDHEVFDTLEDLKKGMKSWQEYFEFVKEQGDKKHLVRGPNNGQWYKFSFNKKGELVLEDEFYD